MNLHEIIRHIQAQRFAVLVFIIIAGLTLRRFGHAAGLSFFVVKYGGSLLWGSMVYFLLAFITAGSSASIRPAGIALMALGLAIGVELFRLYHTPWLDAFRVTTAGALLLGRVFSLWNIAAYAIGIAAACALDPVRLRWSSSRP